MSFSSEYKKEHPELKSINKENSQAVKEAYDEYKEKNPKEFEKRNEEYKKAME